VRLYLDPRPRAQVRVHRVKTRDWLRESRAAVALEERAHLILAECGPATEFEARADLAGCPRFTLHVAPRGHHWAEMVGHWFPIGSASGPRRGLQQLAFERDSERYAWTR